jgi:K+-transporting ATPase KdpF subunit
VIAMTMLTWLGGGVAALLFVYLMFALLYPEKLS